MKDWLLDRICDVIENVIPAWVIVFLVSLAGAITWKVVLWICSFWA